jgi:hypothetical protein
MARFRASGDHSPMVSLPDTYVTFVCEGLLTRAFVRSCRWRRCAERAEMGALANPSNPGYAGSVDSFHSWRSRHWVMHRIELPATVWCAALRRIIRGRLPTLAPHWGSFEPGDMAAPGCRWLRLSTLLSSAKPNGTRCLAGACCEIEPRPFHQGHALSGPVETRSPASALSMRGER